MRLPCPKGMAFALFGLQTLTGMGVLANASQLLFPRKQRDCVIMNSWKAISLLPVVVPQQGKPTFTHHSVSRSVFAGYLIRFKIDRDSALPIFVFSFLQSAAYWSQLNSHKRVVAQPNVNAKQLASLRLPLPPLPQQTIFAQRVAEIRGMEAAQATSRARLDALFHSTLHRAFNGEL